MNTPNNAAALLPCPFCGGNAYLSDYECGKYGMPIDHRNPKCERCGVDLGYDRKDRAIAAWNHRATLAQPDALTSQPSGEAVAEITGIDEYGPRLAWHKHWVDCGVGAKLYTHPSADAPGVAVDGAMVERALYAFTHFSPVYSDDSHAMMRAALVAALAPKPEGE